MVKIKILGHCHSLRRKCTEAYSFIVSLGGQYPRRCVPKLYRINVSPHGNFKLLTSFLYWIFYRA